MWDLFWLLPALLTHGLGLGFRGDKVGHSLLKRCQLLAGIPHYWSTWPRVSGSLRAKKLPTAKAPDAKRMGTALVMPTNDWKMLMPRTAANLHKAFRNPKAVVLLSEGYSSTVSTSRAFHDAMLMPPNRQSKAIIADSLFPNDRKKQLTQEITLEPASILRRPILSISKADTMFPGRTASVPRKLTK